MKAELVQALTSTFEAHAQQTDSGVEFWLARDLQHLLGYAKWDNFLNAVSKARTACEVSGHEVADHFADVGKMVDLWSGSRREKVPDNRPLADFAPTIILEAKDFAAEITIFDTRECSLASESAISREHVTNNQAVRQTLLDRGIRPETLPAAADVKKVERRLTAERKKSLKKPDALDS